MAACLRGSVVRSFGRSFVCDASWGWLTGCMHVCLCLVVGRLHATLFVRSFVRWFVDQRNTAECREHRADGRRAVHLVVRPVVRLVVRVHLIVVFV